MMVYFEIFFMVIVVLSLATMPICIIILRLTLDRRVRKQLPKEKSYDHYPDQYFGFGRTIVFSYASILDYANNSSMMELFYDGFDVKNFATTFEKFIAYCFLLGVIVLVGGGTIYTALDMFGFISI